MPQWSLPFGAALSNFPLGPPWWSIMIIEKRIASEKLLKHLDEVLDELAIGMTVYFVTTEAENWRGDSEFVLGSPDVCGRVLGLVDEEYGWPKTVDADGVSCVSQMAPSYRTHPFIVRAGKTVAVGIQVCEYRDIRDQLQGKDTGR
jgi:hypothetical protein